MRQAVVRHQRGDVRQFGLLGAQKLAARRNIEEQIADRDDGAAGQRRFVAAQHLAARDLDRGAGGLFGRPRLQQQPRDRRDRRQRFAAKPSVAIDSRSFTSRSLLVAWRSKASSASSRSMPAAVVGDADQPPAAGFDVHPDIRRARIERVLEQFLDDRCRPLHHLSRGDLVGDVVGENADAAHRTFQFTGGREKVTGVHCDRTPDSEERTKNY